MKSDLLSRRTELWAPSTDTIFLRFEVAYVMESEALDLQLLRPDSEECRCVDVTQHGRLQVSTGYRANRLILLMLLHMAASGLQALIFDGTVACPVVRFVSTGNIHTTLAEIHFVRRFDVWPLGQERRDELY
ncbi:hypothetical protein F2P81_014254 [Scophthalmus maximus]|uniref:Uncharacterized protein n=1 Tax=Scophthalmus maximus TaxID=52904 RepID=A0A6A4SQ04_SCOMX|nr:hypothetical protein F2P81_014254 [Scophthalmus maximus]